MGAEVVKIEPPGKGDPMREWGQGDKPAWWRVIGRNKYSVAVDLRSEEGQQLARDLIGEADVLVENFRPGALEKWHLDPVELRKTNPGLIVSRMSGYGQTGPYADRPGFGLIGEGFGGLRGIVGEPDRMPSRSNLWLHGHSRGAASPRQDGRRPDHRRGAV
jgi:formyl-CoA transferase